jgi:hypothetical protein
MRARRRRLCGQLRIRCPPEKKTLLFLKKKKQKDFGLCAVHG